MVVVYITAGLRDTLLRLARDAEPDDVKAREGSTMGWGTRRAFESVPDTPAAVVDSGEVGKEAIAKLVAPDAGTLVDRVLALDRAVGDWVTALRTESRRNE